MGHSKPTGTDLKTRESEKPHVTKEDIKKGLREVGISDGAIVFAHSSLSSFGFVEGGADTVIDALLEAVGPQGTIALPTFTFVPGDIADDAEGVFDVANEPVPPSIGAIPETFRKRQDAIRSHHICHSIAAIGPEAESLMGEGVYGYGKGSSFDRLYELDAWNIFLGATFNSCTALHVAEEQLEVPFRRFRTFKGYKVRLPNGEEIPSRCIEFQRAVPLDCHKGNDYYDGYDLGKMGAVFEKEGILRTRTIGESKVLNAKIRDIVDVTNLYLEVDPGYLLTAEAREKVREVYGC